MTAKIILSIILQHTSFYKLGVEGVGIMNPCEIVHENQPGTYPGGIFLMQNKLHEAQSLPRRNAGYYETH
jgi:hypothetical protein